MGRGIVIALVASLGLNIFAVGFLAGRMIHKDSPPPIENAVPRGIENPFRLLRHADALPAESREAFRDAIRSELPSMRAQRHAQRAAHKRLAALLAAEEWDRAAIQKEFDALAVSQNEQRQVFNDAFLNAFETLSAEDRRLLMALSQDRRPQPPPRP